VTRAELLARVRAAEDLLHDVLTLRRKGTARDYAGAVQRAERYLEGVGRPVRGAAPADVEPAVVRQREAEIDRRGGV